MSIPNTRPPRLSLKRHPPFLHWLTLLSASFALAWAFDALHLPAALLLGAMFSAIAIAISDGVPRIPRKAFVLAQGVIGCMVARGIDANIVASLHQDWFLFLSVTLVVILACAGMGWILARKQVLPGTTAVWGCSPGGAAVMTLMSDAHGGDMRLVAVMQYLRVVVVTVAATLVSRLWIDHAAIPPSVFLNWFSPIDVTSVALTLGLAFGCSLIGVTLKIPGGAILLPLIVGSTLQTKGYMTLSLPPWALTATYMTLGWSIGLRFTRQALAQAAQALIPMLVSIACLVSVCACIALALTHLMQIDPLTAYLATSPGGLDAIAIIATSSGINIPFVMAFQTARLLIVVFTGPAIAKYIAARL